MNKLKSLITILLFFLVLNISFSQNENFIRKELENLFDTTIRSELFSADSKLDSEGINYMSYSTILEKDILVEVVEYQEDHDNMYNSILLENKAAILEFGEKEFSELSIFTNESTKFSALVISDLGEKVFYTQGVIYYTEDLLFKITLMTNEAEVYSKLSSKYKEQFLKS